MPESFVTSKSVLRFEFPARGNKPPITLKWHEGGLQPENRPEWLMESLPKNGMIMVGSKNSVKTGGRPNDSQIIMSPEELEEFNKNPTEPSIARIPNENQYYEWLNAIKGNGPMPGSNFEYSTRLTEMALVGVLAQRFDTRIEFDSEKMEITNHPELNVYLKEPVRDGWKYGDELW